MMIEYTNLTVQDGERDKKSEFRQEIEGEEFEKQTIGDRNYLYIVEPEFDIVHEDDDAWKGSVFSLKSYIRKKELE